MRRGTWADRRPVEFEPCRAAREKPAVDAAVLRQLTGEALAAVRAAAGCRTILEAGPHLMDATAAVVRIEQLVVGMEPSE